MSSAVDCIEDCLPNNTNLIVAFASLEGDMVDQHFGSSQGFYVYDVSQDEANLLIQKKFAREAKDGNEDKLKPKLSWLVGCDLVYCGSIGGSATRQLISLGITPKKVTGGPDVEELIEELQSQLQGETEFWLANIIRKKSKQSKILDASVQNNNKPAFAFSEDEEDWG